MLATLFKPSQYALKAVEVAKAAAFLFKMINLDIKNYRNTNQLLYNAFYVLLRVVKITLNNIKLTRNSEISRILPSSAFSMLLALGFIIS